MERYEKVQRICKIELGDIFLVEEKATSDRFIMKRIFIDEREQQHNHPENEARLLEQLDHPNIIKMREHFYHKKYFCLIMEYAEKGDLDTMIKKMRQREEQLNEKKVMDLFCQLCLAVKYLHDKKYIHRDIKIHNIFLSNNDIVKLGDFGISIQLEKSEIFAKTQLGTPYYLSPEVVQGKNYDQKVDIWMMGCFLYEICQFVKPFQGKTWSEVDYKILNTQPEPIDDQSYSEFLQILVKLMLQKDPIKRPSINEILEMPEIVNNLKQMSQEEIYSQYLIFPDSIHEHDDEEENENEKTVIKEDENDDKGYDIEKNKISQEDEDQLAKYSLSYLLKKAEESIKKEELLNKQLKQQEENDRRSKRSSLLQQNNEEDNQQECQNDNINKISKSYKHPIQQQSNQENQFVKKNKFQQIFQGKQKEELNILSINCQEEDQENMFIPPHQNENNKLPSKNMSAPSTSKITQNTKINTQNSSQVSISSQNQLTQQPKEELDLCENFNFSLASSNIELNASIFSNNVSYARVPSQQVSQQSIPNISQNLNEQNLIEKQNNHILPLNTQSQINNHSPNLTNNSQQTQNSQNNSIISSSHSSTPIPSLNLLQQSGAYAKGNFNKNAIINNQNPNPINQKFPVQGQPTTKQNQQSFNFSYNYNANLLKMPQSPNRTILFSDFLKQKLGMEKFIKMKQLLESSPNPLKVLDENAQLITEIIGSENIDCIKMFRCLITSSVTPPGSHFRARSTANSPSQNLNKQNQQQQQTQQCNYNNNPSNTQFSIHLKSANLLDLQQQQNQLQSQQAQQQQQQQQHLAHSNPQWNYGSNNNINNNHHAMRNQSLYSQYAHPPQGQMSLGNSPQFYQNNCNRLLENQIIFHTKNNESNHNNIESEWQQILNQEGKFNPQQMSKSSVHQYQNYQQQITQRQINQQKNYQQFQQQTQYGYNQDLNPTQQNKSFHSDHRIASTTLHQNSKQMFHSSHFYQQ